MSGLVIASLLGLVVVTFILAVVPTRRKLWPVVAAPLVLGLAGYAWQGQPEQESSPAQSIAAQKKAANALLSMRAEMDDNFGVAKQYLILADAFARDGKYDYAASYINSGLSKYPEDGDLWSGLGVVILLAGENKMSLQAQMAFANARKFKPTGRAPDYFSGLNALFDGDVQSTVRIWQSLLDNAPANATWKPRLESQLSGLKDLLPLASPAPVK